MKCIALERGLEPLKLILENKGYRTVFADEMDEWVSAYIYQDQNALGQQSLHSSLNNSLVSSTNEAGSGVLLIQAGNRTPEQIIYMIESRVYSPLFDY